MGRAAVCAGGRRPAREIATREPAARSGRSRSPPVPSGPSGALHTGGAWSLGCGLARRLEARPGPAAALRHRGQAPQAPQRPSCLCCLRRRWCSGRRRARPPARLGVLTSFGAAPRSPPVPSGPSGALHTGGTFGAVWCRPGPAVGSGTCFRGMYSAISHAIPSEQLACSYHFVSLSHSCLGIACGFGVGRDCGFGGGVHRGCGYGRGWGSPGVQIWCGCGVDECAWEFLGPRWD